MWYSLIFTYFYLANLHYKCKCELVYKVVCLCAKLFVVNSTQKVQLLSSSYREGVNFKFGKIFHPFQFIAIPLRVGNWNIGSKRAKWMDVSTQTITSIQASLCRTEAHISLVQLPSPTIANPHNLCFI